METQLVYLFNSAEIPSGLYHELKDYCIDNYIPYRLHVVAEKVTLQKGVFRVRHNFQIEVSDFSRFFINLYERKNIYFKKCNENEIL